MKYKAIILIVAVAVGSFDTVNAQFLKKLGQKAEKAAERTVERRVERETAKKTDKALDKVFEAGDDQGKDAQGKDEQGKKEKGTSPSFLAGMEDVPDTYTFSYRATMKIIDENEKEETNIRYWLEPDAAYFGTEVLAEDAANQIAVMDMDIKGMVMFMDNGKQKTAIRLKGSQKLLDKYTKKATEEEAEDIKVTPIAGKTILGYRCKGFQMESEDGVSKVWVTDEAPVGMLNGALQADYIPKDLPDFGPGTLFMEMEYVSKADKNEDVDRIRMVCTELKPAPMTIRKKDYQ